MFPSPQDRCLTFLRPGRVVRVQQGPLDWGWGVVVAEPGSAVTVDGRAPTGCTIELAGELAGVTYESRRCLRSEGAHRFTGERPFGVVVYGYGAAGSYAFVGGADVRRIYDPPG